MRLALSEAVRGQGRVEPNPMVGAVIVRNQVPIGIGHHAFFGGDHAEVAAIKNCTQPPNNSAIYVTLEPCSHFGKTPPCVKAIIESGIKRVVVATADPNPQVNGKGLSQLREAGLTVDLIAPDSEIAQAAYRLNLPFFKRMLTGRPFVIAKWAMSLDGRMALASGDSRWISNARSRSLVHELRGRVDAIMVGVGTVKTDDPLLTARPAGARTPVRVVVDPKADIPLTSKLIDTAPEIPVWIFCSEAADQVKLAALQQMPGCRVIRLKADASGHLDPIEMLDVLGCEAITNILLEGGPRLLGHFFQRQCIDQVQVYIAPVLFGGPPRFAPLYGDQIIPMDQIGQLKDLQRVEVGLDTCITGLLPTPWLIEHGISI